MVYTVVQWSLHLLLWATSSTHFYPLLSLNDNKEEIVSMYTPLKPFYAASQATRTPTLHYIATIIPCRLYLGQDPFVP